MNSILTYKDNLLTIFPSSTMKWEEAMSNHTSFRIGGPADLLFIPETVRDIKRMLAFCKDHNVPFYIMGNGSNLLVGDKGFRGVVIQISRNMNQVTISGTEVFAQAGVLLSTLANKILQEELAGFEFASGIPGTLGGAVYMNAGAYDGEMKDVLLSAEIITRKGDIKTLDLANLGLGYRSSHLMANGDIVLSAKMRLTKGDAELIRHKMDDLNMRRKDKQPLEKPSAGSTFKRPVGYYAGKLIMDAGLRGYTIGGAQVSDKHCGFVVNTGNATAKDVKALVAYIQQTVEDRFGVILEPEVRMIGEF